MSKTWFFTTVDWSAFTATSPNVMFFTTTTTPITLTDDTEPATPDPEPVDGTPPDADTAPEPKNDVVPPPTLAEEDQP